MTARGSHAHEAVAQQCPISCLRLPLEVYRPLTRARGNLMTVGDLLRLDRQQLKDIRGLGPGRVHQITEALTAAGFSPSDAPKAPAAPHEHEAVTRDCPISCLRLSTRARNALTYAPSNPRTVGDVLRLFDRRQIRYVRGLGPQRIREITLALASAGFLAGQDHGSCGEEE